MLEKAGIHQKKEKFSDRLLKHSAFGVQTNNKPAVSSQQQLGSMEAPENKPLTSAPITQNKPITQPLTQKPVQITGANQTHKAYSNPIRSSSPPKPPSPATTTKIPRPFSKIAYKRNTGLADSDGLPYTNTDDVILLNKLGYTIDENSYMFLPRGEDREGLYTYIEKNAGIPKDVSRCIDEGTAFSAEYLKDMDYEVPKGYEIKGDLCCPVEKTASTLVVSGIHGDEPAGDVAAEKLKGTTDVISDINPTDKRRFRGKDINRHFDKPVEGSIQQKLLDIIDSKRPSKVVALHEDDEVDKPYAYSSPSLAHEVKEALKDKDTATSAHNDKTDDGVISEGKNPPKGSLEKALDNRGVAHATIETPSKSQNMGERTKTHLDVIKSLLAKEAGEKPGLWANIRAKKARGEKAAKPGSEDYPDKKQWDRLTQPNIRENMPASEVRIAKQGEDDLEKTASPFSRRLMSILNKSDQATKNKVIQQLIDYAKKEDKRPNENFLKKLLGYVNRHEREGFDGWSFMSPEEAADRYSPLTGVYKKYFEKPTRLQNNDIASGRKKTEKEKNVSSLLANIFGDNENPTNEYSLIPSDAGLRATLGSRVGRGRAAHFEEQAKATSTPVSLSEHELDMLGRHKISPYFRSLDDTDYRHSSRAKDRIKELMRKGQGVKGLLAQYKIDEQPFEDLLFTPHLANRNNLARQEVMDRYRDYKERIDPDYPGFSDRFLELKLFPAKNKTWAKNPLYEAVVDASNIQESKGPIGVSRYYVPSKAEEAGAILAKNLPNADAGFMYKGGPPSALQAAKKLKNYTRYDERMFFSGVPEISAGYMAKGDPEYTEYVRPAGFGDIRKRIADSVRQYRNTIKKPVEDYFKNNTVDYVGPSVPTKTKSKAKRLKKEAPSVMSQFKQASSNQPMLPGMKQWVKKQPFNYAEDAYKKGRIPKHVRDDIVSGRAAEEFRPKFKEMLDTIVKSRQNK
jgi:hypothetical protein